MRLFSWGLALSHGIFQSFLGSYPLCHAPTIYLKYELESAKHLVSLDAYNFFHCCNNHWSIFRIIEFKYFQLLAYQYYQTHLLHMNHYPTKVVRSHHLCQNEMFRYSLLHKCIICTTLPFHRAFPAANLSWLPSSCTYYPVFITTLEMVPKFSSIHHFSH